VQASPPIARIFRFFVTRPLADSVYTERSKEDGRSHQIASPMRVTAILSEKSKAKSFASVKFG
jgi:hypothetical protein